MNVTNPTNENKPPTLAKLIKVQCVDDFCQQAAEQIGNGETDFPVNKYSSIIRSTSMNRALLESVPQSLPRRTL